MIWLSNSTLARLRDQLLESGGRPTLVSGDTATAAQGAAERPVQSDYAPLCEAMYLMMTADGEVSDDEREVLRGALRNLSGDTLRRADVEALLDVAARNVQSEGRGARLKAVGAALAADRGRAEVAFVLAAAIAFADSAIADNENETLNAFAEALAIDEARAETILDDVERDLAASAGEG